MPRADYTTCKDCTLPSSEVGPLSHQRLCGTCAKRRQDDNLEQLQSGEGPFNEHWERRLVMSLVRRKTKRLEGTTS